ncbi:alpha/beta hydrolase [Mycobacteroides abscessus]|uniref:alpha/beta hydrolase n=1 Tax=Mycobacteroides abscessus TaxID=36809 RepID=UPI000C268D1F|nr:alpha/beta hydrolase [Mycobacteroides abscessus]
MVYAFDPEIADTIPFLPSIDAADPASIRARLSEIVASSISDAKGVMFSDLSVSGGTVGAGLPLRIYRPELSSAPAAIYAVHGGGFIAGDLELEHAQNIELAREVGVVVISVEYRLAPEVPFPGPLDDVYAGLVWLAENAGELGVDRRRIAIHGVSAGGGLCAALALLARDRGGPDIAFQFLAVPALDDRIGTPSMTEYVDTPMWDRPNAIASWEHYLGVGARGTDEVSIYAAPARATDLAGLPPAYISVMHFDPLRDEGIAYAQALLAAGNTVELHLFPGTFHGSALIARAKVSRRELTERIAVLRQALAV